MLLTNSVTKSKKNESAFMHLNNLGEPVIKNPQQNTIRFVSVRRFWLVNNNYLIDQGYRLNTAIAMIKIVI